MENYCANAISVPVGPCVTPTKRLTSLTFIFSLTNKVQMFTAVILVWVSLFKRIYSHPTISNVRFCSTLRLTSLYPPRSVWSPDWETTDGRLNNIHVIAGPAAGIYILMEPIHFRYPGLEIIWDRSKSYIYLWNTSSLGTDCLLLGFLDCWPIRGCMLLF